MLSSCASNRIQVTAVFQLTLVYILKSNLLRPPANINYWSMISCCFLLHGLIPEVITIVQHLIKLEISGKIYNGPKYKSWGRTDF